jgi:DNA-binding transcriptional ArsR family regulator
MMAVGPTGQGASGLCPPLCHSATKDTGHLRLQLGRISNGYGQQADLRIAAEASGDRKEAADGRPVQPAMDRSVANPIVIDGYDWSAIDEHLKKLIEHGLVDATEPGWWPCSFSGATGSRRAISTFAGAIATAGH